MLCGGMIRIDLESRTHLLAVDLHGYRFSGHYSPDPTPQAWWSPRKQPMLKRFHADVCVCGEMISVPMACVDGSCLFSVGRVV